MHSRSSHLDALPVEVSLAGDHAEAIRRWLESVAGWQAQERVTVPALPPVLRIVDTAGAVGPVVDRLPTILLVAEGDDPTLTAIAGRRVDDVVAWPAERGRLQAIASRLIAAHPARPTAPQLRIGGAVGGVGTTTVSLALGALVAWNQGRGLVLTHGAVPADLGPAVPPEHLDSLEVWDRASPVTGVEGLRAVRCAEPPRRANLRTDEPALVISDLGVDEDVDVLVIRRDRPSLDALARATAAVTVCVGLGPFGDRAVTRAAGGRRVVRLAMSTRVSRAGAALRVPAGLPGSWLRTLRPVLGGSS
jgi:hypothetical protein